MLQEDGEKELDGSLYHLLGPLFLRVNKKAPLSWSFRCLYVLAVNMISAATLGLGHKRIEGEKIISPFFEYFLFCEPKLEGSS